MDTPNKETIISLLRAWINQRPGLDPVNYGFAPYCNPNERRDALKLYRSEMRHITKQKHDAETLLRAVELSGITAEGLRVAFRAYSGRLELKQEGEEYRLSYCAGQYWPTEYRAAACAVLASALWDYHRDDYAATAKGNESAGDAIRRNFKRVFGRGIASTWFD